MRLVHALRVLLLGLVVVLAASPTRASPQGLRRIAIVVGANDPPPGRSALRFAHKDATDLADTLQRVGVFASADIHVLLDPRPAELIATLDGVAKTAADAGGDVLFVFYYSGHSDGQSLFPNGEPVSLVDLRGRVERLRARIRVGILDTCRGGGWTQSKGLSVGPPLSMADLLNVDTEGTALLSSSSGLENAHEALQVQGSFFTHHFTAGLRGAADRTGDGNVTLEEAFDYARGRTVRDSARLAQTPQHPSFDLALRGRQDVVLTVLSASSSALQVTGTHPSLEVIHLPSGVTVADAAAGQQPLRLALPPGHYLVRSVSNGQVYAKELEIRAGETATLVEGQLEAVGTVQLAMKDGAPGNAVAAPEATAAAKPTDAAKPTAEAKPGADAAAAKDGKSKAGAKDSKDDDDDHDDDCKGTGTDPDKNGSSSVCFGGAGLRGSVTDLSGALTKRGAGLAFSFDHEGYGHQKFFSSRWQFHGALGGGGAGLEGALLGGATGGFRIPVTEHQGPVLRAGAKGYLLGNNLFYASLIELPELHVGWQWSKGLVLVEVAATGGVVLTGRFRAGEAATREMGSGFGFGGHAAVLLPWGRLSLAAEQLPSADDHGSVRLATAALCAVTPPVTPKRFNLAICLDGRVQQGNAEVAGVTRLVRASYAGLTMGSAF